MRHLVPALCLLTAAGCATGRPDREPVFVSPAARVGAVVVGSVLAAAGGTGVVGACYLGAETWRDPMLSYSQKEGITIPVGVLIVGAGLIAAGGAAMVWMGLTGK